MISLICPISPYRVNEAVARLVGLTMVVLIGLYALTGFVWIAMLIALDYAIRGFSTLPYSPASWLAHQIAEQLTINSRVIDKGPKIFAARVGFLLAFSSVMLFFLNPTASIIAMLILMFFATLESVFNYCVGCVMYSVLVFPIFGKRMA